MESRRSKEDTLDGKLTKLRLPTFPSFFRGFLWETSKNKMLLAKQFQFHDFVKTKQKRDFFWSQSKTKQNKTKQIWGLCSSSSMVVSNLPAFYPGNKQERFRVWLTGVKWRDWWRDGTGDLEGEDEEEGAIFFFFPCALFFVCFNVSLLYTHTLQHHDNINYYQVNCKKKKKT